MVDRYKFVIYFVVFICIFVGKEVEIVFRNLRNGYSWDKKGVRNVMVSGIGIDFEIDVKREILELFFYLEWFELYI